MRIPRAHVWPTLIVCLFAGAGLGFASPDTYGLLNFSPPAGWDLKERPNDIVLSGIDKIKGIYTLILISRDQSAPADPSSTFASEWKAVVIASFPGAAEPESTPGRTSSGLRYREGSAAVQLNGNPSFVSLMVFEAGPRLQSIMIVNPDRAARQSFEPQISAFLGGLRFASAAAETHTQPRPANAGSIKGSGITGVWMGFRSMTLLRSYEPSQRWTVFFADGLSFEDLPDKGLEHFDRAASRADPRRAPYWGTYSLNGKSGAIIKPGATYPTTITVETDDRIKLDLDFFVRCKNPKGVLLQGSWTSYGDPHDKALAGLPEGKRPILIFARDGRFVDSGVFATLLRSSYGADDPRDAAGSGAYALGDYTLILKYDDGRVKEVAFSGLTGADTAVNNDIVFIGRARFNKIK